MAGFPRTSPTSYGRTAPGTPRSSAGSSRSSLISPFVVCVAVNVILGPPWAGMSSIIWFSPLANAGIIAFLWSVSAGGGGPRLAIGPEGAWLRAVHWPVRDLPALE